MVTYEIVKRPGLVQSTQETAAGGPNSSPQCLYGGDRRDKTFHSVMSWKDKRKWAEVKIR